MLSAGMSEHKAKKPFKKIIKKRNVPPPPIHPHIEHVQTEISLLQAELDELEAKGTELTNEEEIQKTTKKACIERYQTTLIKLTDSAMKDKLRAYHESYVEREIKYKVENQTLALLQFFYITRLAQFGLFSAIQVDHATEKLFAITDLSDQLIGASVYAAKDPNYLTRSYKRKFVFDALKKFETGSEDRVTSINDVTFKQLKTLFDDIWGHTIDEVRALKRINSNDANWLVIPAEEEAEPENGTLHVPEESLPPPVEQPDCEEHDQNEYEDNQDEDSRKKSSETGSKVEYDSHDQTNVKEEEPLQPEESYQENNTEQTIEDGSHDDFDHDFDKKCAESNTTNDNWRLRNDDQFHGRGKGTSPRAFKRGSGRGRNTRGKGARGAPRGRGRGRGYETREEFEEAE